MNTLLYKHQFLDVIDCPVVPGKAVCVGRNYSEHANELNNPLPQDPLLFLKPASAMVDMREPIVVPTDRGTCHHELEVALLIGKTLTKENIDQHASAIVGVSLALDLTLRDLQSELKHQGHPWERAKAFDGSCPLSPFISAKNINIQNISLQLYRDQELLQQGNTSQMLFSIPDVLASIVENFTLYPGDVVLTGTPAGVGALKPGMKLKAVLEDLIVVTTTVV